MINPLAENYATQHTTPESEVLSAINQTTQAHHSHAHMLSGHVQGKLLEFLSELINPEYILEIGTFTGYSAICLAKGLQTGGQLHTIEVREEDALTSKNNFKAANLSEKITLHIGDALNIIPTLPFKWNIAFIDADKTNYISYYEMIVPRLADGGIIITDNVLFHGQVLTDPVRGKNAKAIDAFNKHVAADGRTEQVLLTVRDGLMIIKKRI